MTSVEESGDRTPIGPMAHCPARALTLYLKKPLGRLTAAAHPRDHLFSEAFPMKIAFFSDLHGNEQALRAILADIETERVDLSVFVGDAVNPLPGSERVWRVLCQQQIPMVRGNHEDYIIEFHANGLNAEMAALPLARTIPGPNGDDVLVCHASPTSTTHSFYKQVDAQMAEVLSCYSERVVVAGHFHDQWQQRWRDKLLLICGGGGWPLNSSPTAQYLLLTYRQGDWQPEHRRIPYDHAAVLRELHESGFLIEGGPVAWLIYDELWQADYRLVPFLKWLNRSKMPPVTLDDWQDRVRAYLESIDRWAAMAPLVGGP
jgi:predicted phosphodiesterase